MRSHFARLDEPGYGRLGSYDHYGIAIAAAVQVASGRSVRRSTCASRPRERGGRLRAAPGVIDLAGSRSLGTYTGIVVRSALKSILSGADPAKFKLQWPDRSELHGKRGRNPMRITPTVVQSSVAFDISGANQTEFRLPWHWRSRRTCNAPRPPAPWAPWRRNRA